MKDVYVTLNMGNNNPGKLKDLVTNICTQINERPKLNYKGMQPGDV